MFRNKKGDMTLNLIIGAIIAMVVLVVMLLIFTNKISIFNTSCSGSVTDANNCGKLDSNSKFYIDPTCYKAGSFQDVKNGQVCCAGTTGATKLNCGWNTQPQN